jgi:hypothetical protein
MMKLKAVVSHLLSAFAGVLFQLQASPLAVQKFTLQIDIDPRMGGDAKKGPPGI